MGFLIKNNVLPYKVYSAEIIQTGTNPPTETNIFQNTLGLLNYNYNGLGNYEITSTNLFTINKTFILFNLAAISASVAPIILTQYLSDSLISINAIHYVFSATRFLADDNLLNGSIEIRVYN
jgi:hypothetical protein